LTLPYILLTFIRYSSEYKKRKEEATNLAKTASALNEILAIPLFDFCTYSDHACNNRLCHNITHVRFPHQITIVEIGRQAAVTEINRASESWKDYGYPEIALELRLPLEIGSFIVLPQKIFISPLREDPELFCTDRFALVRDSENRFRKVLVPKIPRS
jgi:hypothetical protein